MVPLTDASADIYNYIDQRGISNFSDQAFPAAKKIILEKPNLYHLNFSNSNPSNSNKAIYQSNHVSIISPADQQHFHNVDNVVVAITCQPALMNNQHIELWVDGGLYKESTRLQFSLLQLTRGEHKLEAKLTEQGKILATSAPVTIFMNQTITYNL
jgi:hypothetical protein